MKRPIALLLLSLLISITASSQAFRMEDPIGTKLEYTTVVIEKDTTYTELMILLDKEVTRDGQVLKIGEKMTTEDPTYLIRTRDELIVDVKQMIKEQLDASLGEHKNKVSIKVTGNNFGLPLQPPTQALLPDQSLEMKVRALKIFGATVKVSMINRKFAGSERIITPAGTFDTFKISCRLHLDVRALGAFREQGDIDYIYWIAPDLGIIKYQETKENSTKVTTLSKRTLP